MKRATIMKLRRAASITLMLAIASALGSLCILVAHIAEWIITGTVTHVTIGSLAGTGTFWLQIPLCYVSPVVAFLALYTFFATWSYAVRKDIEAEGTA